MAAHLMTFEELIVQITFTNKGSEPAGSVQITNPVPQHMIYKGGSAEGGGTDIRFSIDGGDTYDTPENLKVKRDDGVERLAQPAEYTHLRWTLEDALKPDGTGQVWFRAVLK